MSDNRKFADIKQATLDQNSNSQGLMPQIQSNTSSGSTNIPSGGGSSSSPDGFGLAPSEKSAFKQLKIEGNTGQPHLNKDNSFELMPAPDGFLTQKICQNNLLPNTIGISNSSNLKDALESAQPDQQT